MSEFRKDLEIVMQKAMKVSYEEKIPYGVRIVGDSVSFTEWNWYMSHMSLVYTADHMIYVNGYSPSVEKGDYHFITSNSSLIFSSPRGILRNLQTMSGAASAKATGELWWQKQDRLNREAKERVAALHRDIRDITGM